MNTALKLETQAYQDAGLYIMRSREIYLLAVCHGIGVHRNGPHKHNDWLSFELCVGTQPVIIDPGTFCYTGDMAMRRMFRSTSYHNTVTVDREEQLRIDNSMFGLVRPHGDMRVLCWKSDGEQDLLEAEHSGYTRLRDPLVHRRLFILDKAAEEVQITDTFFGSRSCLLEWYFHLEIGLHCSVSDRTAVVSKDGTPVLKMQFPDMTGDIRKEIGWVSRSYNKRREAEVICFEHRVNPSGSTAYTTLLSAAQGSSFSLG